MAKQNDRDHPQSRVKKGSNTVFYIAVVMIVLFVIGFYFYVQKSPSSSSIHHAENTDGGRKTLLPGQAASQLPGLVTVLEDEQTGQRSAQPPLKDISDQIKQRLSAGSNNQYLIDEINLFYAHLDQQPYMQSFGLTESSKAHFSKLLQKLVDNPPVVIRETDDLFTLLQNTAHFFRILGKENIYIIKGILDKEKKSFEQIMKAFYGLTYQPEYLIKEYSLSIPPQILTDYAAFFLNTMGGRLYLFRRDSTSRMVVSYYAIICIDRANSEGKGGHGIDLRPAIHSLVEEIENGGRRLQLKEEYLDTLYDLQEKYD